MFGFIKEQILFAKTLTMSFNSALSAAAEYGLRPNCLRGYAPAKTSTTRNHWMKVFGQEYEI
jgi:hypothetical protein